jgi:integrase
LKLDAFPVSFAEDLTAYLTLLTAPDPFEQPLEPLGDGRSHVARPLSPVTIADRRRFVLRAASILVAAGEPIERMTSLAVLVTERAMRTVLTELYRRGLDRQQRNAGAGEAISKAWTGDAVTMAMVLFDIARRHLRLDKAELERLKGLKAQVQHRYPGLGDRVRARLSQFDDPRALRDLLKLPKSLFEAADKLLKDGCPARAASVHEVGLALALLLLLPMRRRNLAALDLQRHLVRNGQGRVVLLRIPGAEVKNGITLKAEVSSELARRIDRHIKIHRPALMRTVSTTAWLFPGRGEHHRCPEAIANKVSRAVERMVGTKFNLHLIRHLVATLLYDADPNNGPVAQRVLGHAQLKTTERVYGTIRTRGAQRTWADLLDRKRDALRRSEATARGRGGKP